MGLVWSIMRARRRTLGLDAGHRQSVYTWFKPGLLNHSIKKSNRTICGKVKIVVSPLFSLAPLHIIVSTSPTLRIAREARFPVNTRWHQMIL